MMRRGPLADYPIETLFSDAASERVNGILNLRASVEAAIYLVDGDIYLAEVDGQPPLDERLVTAGLLTSAQVEEHGVPGAEGVYLARALDTDASIDEDAIADYLLDLTAATIARFVGTDDGEFELDPYGSHPAGVLSSWPPTTVLARAGELLEEAVRLEAERLEAERAEAERLEAERLEAERLEAERLEAERLEAERLEAERLEAERLEAARREAERAEAERVAAEERAAEQAAEADASAPADEAPDAAPSADEAVDLSTLPPPPDLDAAATEVAEGVSANGGEERRSPLFDAFAANAEADAADAGPTVLVVVAEVPPADTESVALSPIEWRVVVRAAQGDSLGAIARRLELSADEAQQVVDGLCARGLLATIGAGAAKTD